MMPKASATAIVFATAWLGTVLWAWTLLWAKARIKRRFEEQQIAQAAERERLLAQVQDQAALLDLTQDALCVHDVSGQIRFWNSGAERMFGWPRDEIVGRDVNGPLFALNSLELAEAREKFHLGHEWSGELRHRTRAGAEVVARHHWTLVRYTTRASPSILVACTDVTQNRKLEGQFLRLQRVESIGALAGGIAHDLNNVLAPILMSVQLLRDVATDDSVRVMLDAMETSAQRGASILRQLLTFVRGMEGERGLLQPKHLLKEMGEIVAETFPKSIRVEVHYPDRLFAITADPTQLHQVLLNLCVNARDAMPQGGLLTLFAENVALDDVNLRLDLGAAVGPYVKLGVADTGSGIPTELVGRIFEPFFTTKPAGRGTGLGLSVALGITKSHGGFMRVETEPGKGSRFLIFLPATFTEADSAVAPTGDPPEDGQGERILLVDDEDAVRLVARTILETHGYRVLTAKDGFEALALYSEHRRTIQAVITDMMMPGIDGRVLSQILLQLEPGLKIIAASGVIEAATEAETGSVVWGGRLAKPFTGEQLLAVLHRVLAE